MNGLSGVSVARTPVLSQGQTLSKLGQKPETPTTAKPTFQPQPKESLELTHAEAPVVEESPSSVVVSQPKAEVYSPPSTLTMEEPTLMETSPVVEGRSPLATLTQASMAKMSSEAHWDSALEAFADLPEEDRVAAGKRAFYTQAASLPEFAETLNGLQPEMKPLFPVMIQKAKEANAIGNLDLDAMVKKWSAENPEQAYIAQMNGFADYAGEQLVNAAIGQGASSLDQMEKGPREEALGKVQLHSDGYVRDRGAFFSGAHQLMTDGHTEMAQQLLH